MYLLVDDSSSNVKSSLSLSDIVVPARFLPGFVLDIEEFNASQSKTNVAATLSRQNIRNVYGVSAVFRLLRFMSNEQKEKWLFDLLALILASRTSVTVILSCDDWQPCLFQLVAEVFEEINGDNSCTSSSTTCSCDSEVKSSNEAHVQKFDTHALSRPSVRTRYDLSLKLYSSLVSVMHGVRPVVWFQIFLQMFFSVCQLGHCVRKGDDKAFDGVETAASLQRVDVNGSEVFGIILSHLFADLIEKGTVEFVEETYQKESPSIKNRALKQSARLVTQGKTFFDELIVKHSRTF
jgi:hypothetical protein